MAKSLILAEKPSQAQDIARGLDDRFERRDGYLEGSRYIITWAFGHLVQLAEPHEYDEKYKKWLLEDLPILPERFRYVVTKDKYKQFKVIKELINRSDVKECLICTDPGREGELIARLILMKAGNRKPVYRFWTSKALTPDAVREGFQNLKPASEFDRLYESALARQRADWLVGLNATRAWSVKGKTLLSVGRVQTAVLKLLCDRENEIRNFKPKDYWLVKAQFQKGHDQYEGVWIGQDGKDENTPEADTEGGQTEEDSESTHSGKRIDREETAREIKKRIAGSRGVVRTVRQKLKQESPPLLFSLTVLQQEANRLFGFSADKTLKVAQELYEAKLTTYPRTESQHLNEEMVDECIKIINSLKRFGNISETFRFDPEKCRIDVKNKRVFDSKKLTDHHALIPTGKLPDIKLAPDEMKLFELICRRFIAAFYPAYKYRSTTVITAVGRDVFLSQGKAVVDLGWKEVYGGAEKDQLLPDIQENDQVVVRSSEVEKKQTKPPSRYTDASILKAMTSAHKFVKDEKLKKILKENAGVGTPATRAQILVTLKERGYVARKGKSLMVTDKGMELIKVIGDEKIADVGYTALWEQELERIARGEVKSSEAFMKSIISYTKELIEKAKGVSLNISNSKQSIGKCPECGADVHEGDKSYYCTRWKEGCRFSIWKGLFAPLGKKTITVNQAKALIAGKTITIKGLKSKKTGKKFDSKARLTKDSKYGWKVEIVFK